jgi:hypothetical protein
VLDCGSWFSACGLLSGHPAVWVVPPLLWVRPAVPA